MTQMRLLYVDRDPGFCIFYQTLLRRYGFVVNTAASSVAVMEHINSSAVHAVVVSDDLQFNDLQPGDLQSDDFQSRDSQWREAGDAFVLAARIKQWSPASPVVMLSACESVVEDATRFVDAAFCTGSPVDGLVDLLRSLIGRSAGRDTVAYGWVAGGKAAAGL
jgi:CheY-like chemotaxis protein